ncbi:MAG TPA: PhzF family phenazine biosynthesis protein [Mycobacteriales bacterium]|jgi:PhzF family phenazine biosynthesis protein
MTALPGGRVEFAIVDVFAVAPLTGNALAVVPDADALDVPTMRAIAREFNQSETTFLVRPTLPAAAWRLRSFTPGGHEVGGAGHNALGAWLWLADAGRVGAGTFTQQIGTDLLPVEVATGEPTRVTMDQSAPRFGGEASDRAELAAALGLTAGELVADRPAQVVSTGAGHLLVPVASRAAVDRVAVDTARLLTLLVAAGGEGCYIYTTEAGADGADAYARFVNPAMGIVEDPATGTAAGPLAAVLVRHGDVPAGRPVLIQQGNATGRPSRLRVDVDRERVRITGTGLVVAAGHLTVRVG